MDKLCMYGRKRVGFRAFPYPTPTDDQGCGHLHCSPHTAIVCGKHTYPGKESIVARVTLDECGRVANMEDW